MNELVLDHQLKQTPKPSLPAAWEIRLEEQEFIKSRSSLEDHFLFFDGASKVNPGPAGGGGVIISSYGSRAVSFSWELGQETNNKEDSLALWQGLKLARSKNIQSLVVFGDLRIIIQELISKHWPSQVHLASILKKINLLISNFQNIIYFMF